MTRVNLVYYPANANSGVVAGARIARWLASKLKNVILVDGKNVQAVAKQLPAEYVLYIINVPKPMVAHVEAAEILIEQADWLVWVQNDYAIQTPTPWTNGQSIFTRAFTKRTRRKSGHRMWVWTTCEDRVKHIPDMARYVNWNCLAIDPQQEIVKPNHEQFLYWGAYRPGRLESFRRYFGDGEMAEEITELWRVSATPNGATNFGNHTSLNPPAFIGPVVVPAGLSQYAGTVYIEDDMSHRRYHSPANRFYEALAAGIPMLIDHKAVGTIQKAGYTVPAKYISESYQDVARLLAQSRNVRLRMAADQRAIWCVDPATDLYVTDALVKRVRQLQKECLS